MPSLPYFDLVMPSLPYFEKRRTVKGRVLEGEWREKKSAIEVDVGVGGVKS